MTELTTILRQQSKLGPINVARAAMRDAAAELDRLKARVEELEAALVRLRWAPVVTAEMVRDVVNAAIPSHLLNKEDRNG